MKPSATRSRLVPGVRPARRLGLAALAAALIPVATASGQDVAPPAPPGPVGVFPAPGTTTASPRTEISFRGVAPGALGVITVEGSRSGARVAGVRPHPDGQGASLVFSRPFRAGERVTVRTDLDVAGA